MGIQSDNRAVCWGASEAIKDIPVRAQYLKQVDIRFNYACGVDLTDSLVCWGENIIESDRDQQFDIDQVATLGAIKQVSLGPYGACVIKLDDSVRCFGDIRNYTQFMQAIPVKSIKTAYVGGPALCYEDLDGSKDCVAETFITETDIGFTTVLADGYTPRIISTIGQIYQINDDNSFCSLLHIQRKQICYQSFSIGTRRFAPGPLLTDCTGTILGTPG